MSAPRLDRSLAAWIAFEDTHPDSGPLIYYPGSHKLPYVFCKDVGLGKFNLKSEGYGPNHRKYERYIQDLIANHHLEPHYFPCAERRHPELARESRAWRIGAEES